MEPGDPVRRRQLRWRGQPTTPPVVGSGCSAPVSASWPAPTPGCRSPRTSWWRISLPDDLVTAAVQACDELAALLDELDRWAQDKRANLLEAPEDVKRYRAAYLDQVRAELQAAAR
jgi:hypothetical protein